MHVLSCFSNEAMSIYADLRDDLGAGFPVVTTVGINTQHSGKVRI